MSAFELPMLRWLVIVSLVFGTLPARARAADGGVSAEPSLRPAGGPAVHDCVIDERGTITVRLVSPSGAALSNVPIYLRFGRLDVARAVTDGRGEVTFERLRAGLHEVAAGSSAIPVRFWTPSAAPPHAAKLPALVMPEEVVRGQYGPPMMAGPGILLVGAAAVAVVLAGKSSGSNRRTTSPPASP